MEVTLLLNQVKQIAEKYDQIYRHTGSYFNIFQIADISRNEVIMCRVIKELIDPQGTHYQGAVYLELFMEYVLGRKDFEWSELENAVVEREKLIAGNRRIDLYITVPGKARIPIEVKLFAGDQEAQCYDYYRYADANSKLYYLTLDNHQPSEDSLRGLEKNNFKTISFGKEILNWLQACLKVTATIQLAPIREVILQLMDALRKLTNQMEDKMERELVELLMSSKETFQSAERIASTLKVAEQKLYDQFFKQLHKKICEKYPYLMDIEENLVEGEEEYDQWGIYYVIKHLDNNSKLVIDITSDGKLGTGLRVYNRNDEAISYKKVGSQNSIIKGKWKSEDTWIAWVYFGENGDEQPDFKHHNKAFYDLIEPVGMEAFVETAMQTIDELMGSLLI